MIEDLEALQALIDEQREKARAIAEAQPTRQNWNAVICLDEAGQRVYSAKAWLQH